MTSIRFTAVLIRREAGALAADRRAAAGLEMAILLVAGIVSAMQVAALVGGSLQQSVAQITTALAVLNGG